MMQFSFVVWEWVTSDPTEKIYTKSMQLVTYGPVTITCDRQTVVLTDGDTLTLKCPLHFYGGSLTNV